MAEPTVVTVNLSSHPVALTEREQAQLAAAHDGTPPRANEMVRAPRRVFVGPLRTSIYVIEDDSIHRHEKIGGGAVCPSPTGDRFLTYSDKQDVQLYEVGTEAPTELVFSQAGEKAVFSKAGHLWGADWVGEEQVAVLYSNGPDISLILCQRTELGWAEVDNVNLRGGVTIAALGEFVVIGTAKGNKIEVYGIRNGRIHKCGGYKCSGGPMRLFDDEKWALYLASPYGSEVDRIDGLDALWASAKPIKARKDTHLLQHLCSNPERLAFDEKTVAGRKGEYETFAAQDGKVEKFVGATSRGFLAEWPKGDVRHVISDGGKFATGPKLVVPGERFKPWVKLTKRVGELDVMEMSGGVFVIP